MRGLQETIAIQDTFCSGLGAIERLEGNCYRFYLYVSQSEEAGEPAEKVLVAKIVAPAAAVPDAVLQMIAALGERVVNAIPLAGDLTH